MTMTAPSPLIPALLRHHHTDEFIAPSWTDADRRVLAHLVETTEAVTACTTNFT